MSETSLGSRTFTVADQTAFARWSGDVNPMHMDAVFARRTYSGAAVVHGVHLVLTALDLLARHEGPTPISRLRVTFSKPVNVGETVDFRLQGRARDLTLLLFCQGVRVCSVKLSPAAGGGVAALASGPLAEVDLAEGPQNMAFAQMAGRSGRLRFAPGSGELASAFPAAAAWLLPCRLQTLAALSTLVGMVCPGLNSIFSSIDLDQAETVEGDGIAFSVEEADDRFRRVVQRVAGPGFTGSIGAYAPEAVTQPSCREVGARIDAGRFTGSRSLIVGGSRGLGEVTAKIIAMGGGEPILTYAAGATDAARVADEIQAAGGRCQTLRLDVLEPISAQLRSLGGEVGSVFYYATPPLYRKGGGVFDTGSFALFSRFYLDAFHETCRALRDRSAGVTAFYPSSVAVADRPQGMSEYAMAKAAGEVLCAEMNRFEAGIEVVVHRLPRLPTDLTASLLQTEVRSALDVLVPIVEQVIPAARTPSV